MTSTALTIPFISGNASVDLPVQCDLLRMVGARALDDPETAVRTALDSPIGSLSLRNLIQAKLERKRDSEAVIVISDNTRPVPYKGEGGILMPLVRTLLGEGVSRERITVLVATGTHRGLTEEELREMLDPEIFEKKIRIVNHDCKNEEKLDYLGKTSRGSRIFIDSLYMQADIKILTGLVESHFMAGASGGRKSICPGLIGEKGTFIFHGPAVLDNPRSTDLVLEGNPCHDEALEAAKAAGADFIVNVTLDSEFKVSGVFAGELEKAHKAAVDQMKEHIGVACAKTYDVVISHAGFVGINHYQAAKTGTVAMKVVKPDGYVLVAGDTVDSVNRVGALPYRTALQLLKLIGPEKFMRLIKSDQWEFLPEQWQVQMWCKLFQVIPMDHFYFYSPQFGEREYEIIPGIPGSSFVRRSGFSEKMEDFYRGALLDAAGNMRKAVEDLSVCFLLDGPYGIPLLQEP